MQKVMGQSGIISRVASEVLSDSNIWDEENREDRKGKHFEMDASLACQDKQGGRCDWRLK